MTYRRLLLAVLAVGLLACLYVGVRRERHEHRANRVEIVMDDADFASLARSYAYDQRAFLIALRRAGLTSLAVQEELGGQVAASPSAAVYSGTALLAQSKLFGFRDPVFARLAAHGLRSDEVYLIAYDAVTAQRYARQLALKFTPRSVRVLRAGSRPSSRSARKRYFASVGLGLPAERSRSRASSPAARAAPAERRALRGRRSKLFGFATRCSRVGAHGCATTRCTHRYDAVTRALRAQLALKFTPRSVRVLPRYSGGLRHPHPTGLLRGGRAGLAG